MLLEMKSITKQFPGVLALDKVDFDLKENEVNILVGENGAGKSTLVKVLAGVYDKYEGEIFMNGERVSIHSPKHAQDLGISIIYQEFNLIPQLSVAENIFLGREPVVHGKIAWDVLYSNARKVLDDLQVDISEKAVVNTLGVAQMQMVEVAKALSIDSKIIIMDEPTASLAPKEIENLFRIIRQLKSNGVSIIYISHRLEEYSEIGDRATIMRDGRYIKTVNIGECSREEMIRLMVGRELKDIYPKTEAIIGTEALRVEDFDRKKDLHHISFVLHKGEILGIAGLMGAGRTELARAIFGLDPIDSGKLYIEGKPVTIKNSGDAIRAGMGFITEDRKNEGVILNLDVGTNVSLPSLGQFANGFHVDLQKERAAIADYVEKISIKTPSLKQKVINLSGGNQQKVVIAKWLMTNSRVFIFDEPTRGIDVGAKHEIYELIDQLVQNGAAVILISSEMPELMGMSDKIITLYRGTITAEFSREEFSQEQILNCATGGIKA